MQKFAYAIALSALLLGACDRGAAPPDNAAVPAPATATAAPATTTAPAAIPGPATPKPAGPTAEELAAIEATGKTGLWADVSEVCAKDVKTGIATMVSWNVQTETDGRVIVSLVDTAGKERDFGNGGPIGHKQTGPWLRPGLKFRLRTKDGDKQLAELVIAEKKC